jgi:hypothetical protein
MLLTPQHLTESTRLEFFWHVMKYANSLSFALVRLIIFAHVYCFYNQRIFFFFFLRKISHGQISIAKKKKKKMAESVLIHKKRAWKGSRIRDPIL